MLLHELLYSWPQENNSLEGTPRVSKIHDKSQSMYPATLEKACESGRCISYSSIPSSYCVCQSQNAPIDNNKYEGDCGLSTYAHPLSEVNNVSNSLSMHHEYNSEELIPAAYFEEQNEPLGLNPNERGNTFLSSQDFVRQKSTSFTTPKKTGKKKPRNAEIAANIPVGSRSDIDFRVNRTGRDLKVSGISRPSGSKDRHSKVLTLQGPRDRRIRLSVGTAIKLYCVQDMLGVEQPSQAVEWLIGKSQDVIRKLPQLSCISSSHISEFAQSDKVAVSATCHQTGVPSISTQDNKCTASGDFLVSLQEQILGAKTTIDHNTFTAMTNKASNKHSIFHGENGEQRSVAMMSVASNHRSRETESTLPQKQRRAKARERARERTKEKGKGCKQHSGIHGILQRSSVPPHSPAFSLHGNMTSASSINMLNETTHGIDNTKACLHSLMFPKDSIPLCHSRSCVSSPPAEIQCSFLADVHYSTAQQEGISIQSTCAFSSLSPEVFPLAPDPLPEAVARTNNSSSYNFPCKCPLDHAQLKSSNLYLSCTEDFIEMQGTDNGRLETSYEWQSAWNTEIFEEIPALKPSNQFMPWRINETNASSLPGIFDLPQ